MAYIGKSPIIGNFVKLDAITAVNGQAAYTMQNGGSNFTDYESVNQFLVSLNGIIQAPTDSFTVSGSTLTFASNLSTGDVIDFIMVFGNSLSAGTPTDATVTTAKLAADAVTSAKIADDAISDEHLDPTAITGQTAETSVADDDLVLVSDTSASAALKKMTVSNLVANAGGGKILQVIEDTLEAEFESSSTSYVETGLSVNITPSSTSSKILILGNAAGDTKGDRYIYATIFRDSTNLSSGTGADGFAIIHEGNSARLYGALPVMKLDSPNTTSQVTYTLRARTNSGTFRITQHNQTSVIIVMEVGA